MSNDEKRTQKLKSKLTIHVVQHLAPGGIETLVLEMLRHADKQHPVLIVSLEGDLTSAIRHWPKLAAFKHHLIFLDKLSGVHLSMIGTLCKLFNLLKPHVIHTHHIGPLLYGGVAAKLSHIQCHIHTEHDIWHLSNAKNRRIQSVALAITKPRLVADADEVSSQLSRSFCYPDITVIKNGVDCQHFKPASQSLARQKLGLPLNCTIVGCAGRLEYIKGHDILLHALTLLPHTVSVAIAGYGSRADELKKLAQELNVDDRVYWLGLVTDMPRFYQALDLFCLPSRCEGFPLSTLEAQACDTVTIASQVGAVEETICPNSGLMFPSENPQALADQILAVLKQINPTSPREFVLKNNDIQNMVTAYQSLSAEVH